MINFKWALWKRERDGQNFERGSKVSNLSTGQKVRGTGRYSRLKWDEGITVKEKKNAWEEERMRSIEKEKIKVW